MGDTYSVGPNTKGWLQSLVQCWGRCLPPLNLGMEIDPISKMLCSLVVYIYISVCARAYASARVCVCVVKTLPNPYPNKWQSELYNNYCKYIQKSYKMDFICLFRQNTNTHCSCKCRTFQISSLHIDSLVANFLDLQCF